jgi:predicted RNA-binding protein (virulence factor B family)
MVNIGQVNSLELLRFAGPGAFVDGEELGEILLPKRYVPSTAAAGDRLELFVYRDSEDRLVATTERPLATVGQFAALRVVEIHPRAGAFLDWGLGKDLLLPYREQVHPVRAGDRVVVFIQLDEKSGRIAATARLNRPLNRAFPEVLPRQKVDLHAPRLRGARPGRTRRAAASRARLQAA